MNNFKIFNTILLLINTICLIAITVTFILWPKNTAPVSGGNDQETVTQTDGTSLQYKTPYCTVKYPSKWKGSVKYVEKEENGVYTGTFYCLMKDQEIAMFDIYFGAPETGTYIGSVVKDGKTVAFNVKSSDFQPDPSWSEDERMLYLAMANGINDVIESVTNDPNYLG